MPTTAATEVRILQAGPGHLSEASDLFDAYRQFYKRPPAPEAVRRYLSARLAKRDSVLFLGYAPSGSSRPTGFVTLYPSLDSLAMKPLWILYDLYVAPESRRHGLARALMNRATQLAGETGASCLVLETAKDNLQAQALYEQLGYQRDELFHRYSLPL
ncbi:MAG TPA: GNAT family N-acetyltransferase [Candidatus Acidoferrales bacterium]|nr:GNAT family N-acetyltransferase [Candidatus Acidoferrales bacterium]